MTDPTPGASPVLLLEWWKPVVGWEDAYLISNLGNIRGLLSCRKHKPNRVVKGRCGSNGYLYVTLQKNKHIRRRSIHSLVAEAFIGPRITGKQVNHLDKYRTNPRLSNLAYVTQSENMRHAAAAVGILNPRAKLDDDKVKSILSLRGRLKYKEIASLFDVDPANISSIMRGKIWSHVPRL